MAIQETRFISNIAIGNIRYRLLTTSVQADGTNGVGSLIGGFLTGFEFLFISLLSKNAIPITIPNLTAANLGVHVIKNDGLHFIEPLGGLSAEVDIAVGRTVKFGQVTSLYAPTDTRIIVDTSDSGIITVDSSKMVVDIDGDGTLTLTHTSPSIGTRNGALVCLFREFQTSMVV